MNRFTFTLICFIAFSLIVKAEQPLKVLATASIFADMADNIAGGELEVQSIVPVGGDPHIYEPSPSDARLVSEADLIIRNGLTFEGWLNELIESSGTKAKVITITDGIIPITSQKYKNATDPHAWMDASKGLQYIENIKNAFVELNPDNKEIFEINYGVYKQQIEDLDAFISTQIQKIPEQKRILITSHDAFQYYGRRYNIQLEAILGTSTDAEAQTSDIIRINKIIRDSKIPAVFVESTINPKLLQQLARDNNIRVGGELYADSLGDEQSPASTYLEMLRHNTNAIVQALSKEQGLVENQEAKAPGGNNFMLFALLGLILLGGFVVLVNRINQ